MSSSPRSMKMRLLVLLLFFVVGSSYGRDFGCDDVSEEKITAMTSDGKSCDILTESKIHGGWAWYKCHGIRETVPRTYLFDSYKMNRTKVEKGGKETIESKLVIKHSSNLIDFFELPAGKVARLGIETKDKQRTLFGMVQLNNTFKFTSYDEKVEMWVVSNESSLRVGFNTHLGTWELVGTTRVHDFSFSLLRSRGTEGVSHVAHGLQDEPKRWKRIYGLYYINAAEAFTYLGMKKQNLEVLAVADSATNVSKSSIIKVVYMAPPDRKKIRMLDTRPIHTFIGCPQHLCLEGGIDTIYSTANELFITRGFYLYKVNPRNQIIYVEPVRKFHSQLDPVASFAIPTSNWTLHVHMSGYSDKAYLITYGDHRVFHEKSRHFVSQTKLFPNKAEQSKIFASVQVSQKKHDDLRYYIFAGDKIYEYRYIYPSAPPDIEFELITTYRISERFKNIWPSFDSAFMDPNDKIIYILNQDYNVRYKWKASGIMSPMENPRLNQKTIWKCDDEEYKKQLEHFDPSIKTLDEYFERYVQKTRYEKLPFNVTTPVTSIKPKRTKTKRVLIYLIISSLIVAILLIVTAIYLVWKRKVSLTSTAGNEIGRNKRNHSPQSSFTSKSTTTTGL